MGKKIKKKYYWETAVKKALRIDSFRNLTYCATSNKLYENL